MTNRTHWPWEYPSGYDPRLSAMWEHATIQRRQRMSEAELYRDLLEELRTAAQLRTILYEAELEKAHPSIPKLIRFWSDQWEALEFAAWATPPTHDPKPFEDEMALCDAAIDQLSAPLLKRMRMQ